MKTKILTDERIKTLLALPSHLLFELMDGRLLAIPLDWYPRLRSASPEQLSRWEIRGGGFVVRWPELDEDLEISGLLAGNPAPELRQAGEIASNRIREFRESSGISQEELAEQLGVRQATISDWEKDKTVPSPLAAARLRELVRKHELAKQSLGDLVPQFQSLQSAATDFDYWRKFGFQAQDISDLWLLDFQPEQAGANARLGGEYRFTDLGVVHQAPERRSLLYCARFNPPRQFLHSCEHQPAK